MKTRILSYLAIAGLIVSAAGASLTGCGGAEMDQGTSEVATSGLIAIDSSTIDRLAPGEFFYIDLTREDTVYTVNFADEDLDLSRIRLIEPTGEEVSLSESLSAEADAQGVAFNEVEWGAFTNNAENFGTLDEAQLELLNTEGVLTTDQEDEFAAIEAALKIKIEIYWTTKKGKDVCIRVTIGKAAAVEGGIDDFSNMASTAVKEEAGEEDKPDTAEPTKPSDEKSNL